MPLGLSEHHHTLLGNFALVLHVHANGCENAGARAHVRDYPLHDDCGCEHLVTNVKEEKDKQWKFFYGMTVLYY